MFVHESLRRNWILKKTKRNNKQSRCFPLWGPQELAGFGGREGQERPLKVLPREVGRSGPTWRHSPRVLEPPFPETCQPHLGNSLAPQLGYFLGGREPGPASDFRLVAARGRWTPRLRIRTLPSAAPFWCVVSSVQLPRPFVLRCPSPPGPAASLSPPLTSRECSLVPSRSQAVALVLRKRSPRLLAIEGKSQAVPCSEVTWARGVLVPVCQRRAPARGLLGVWAGDGQRTGGTGDGHPSGQLPPGLQEFHPGQLQAV